MIIWNQSNGIYCIFYVFKNSFKTELSGILLRFIYLNVVFISLCSHCNVECNVYTVIASYKQASLPSLAATCAWKALCVMWNMPLTFIRDLGSFLHVANEDNTKQKTCCLCVIPRYLNDFLFNSVCRSSQRDCNVMSFAIPMSIQLCFRKHWFEFKLWNIICWFT